MAIGRQRTGNEVSRRAWEIWEDGIASGKGVRFFPEREIKIENEKTNFLVSS